MFSFALIENDVVSSSLLRGALSFVRIRTGLQLEAKSWSVSPLLFSASLHEFQLRTPQAKLRAKTITTQISPLSLLAGNISLTYGEINSAELQIEGNLFGESQAIEKPSEKNWIKDLPSILGKEYDQFLNRLRARNLGFEEIELNEISVSSNDLKIQSMSLSWINLGSSQARGRWALSGVELMGRTQFIESFHGAIVLLHRGTGQYSLSIGNLDLNLDKEDSFNLKALGGFPGVVSINGSMNLNRFRKWAAASPILKDEVPDDLSGKLEIGASLELGSGATLPTSVKLSANQLAASGMRFQSLRVALELPDLVTISSVPVVEVREGRIVLVDDFGSESKWKREIDFSAFRVDRGVAAGNLRLTEVGLCSLLESLGEEECYAGVGLTGSIQLQGSLNPLALQSNLDLEVLSGPVTSSPMVPNDDSLILNVKNSRITGTAQVRDDRVHLDALQMIFSESSTVDLSGDVIYTPTQVRLKARAASLDITSVADEVVGLKFTGKGEIDSEIFYDHRQPKLSRTRVLNRVKISDFGLESETFGSLSGNIDYTDRSLRLGPFQIRNGGGLGRLSGSMVSRPDGNFLDLELNVDRLEFRSSSDSEGKPYFRGFLTGGGRLSGYPAPTSGQRGLGADIEFVARNFDAFGIPFQKANLSGTYLNRILTIDTFRATKDGAWLELAGNLNPDGGSEIKFWSDKIPLKNIGLDPGLAVFDAGRVEVRGLWQPSRGWSMDGRLSELQVAGQALPSGDLKIQSENNRFKLAVEISTLLRFSMSNLEFPNAPSKLEEMEVSLKDRGLYAGFAYLGGWLAPRPFVTTGSMAFRWTPLDGYFRSSGLAIQGPVGETGRILDLVTVSGQQELLWKDRKIVTNTLSWKGPSELAVQGNPGESQISIRGRVLTPFLSLFIPGIAFVDGHLEGQAVIPLSPHFDSMRLRGEIVNGGVVIPGLAEPFTNVRGRINMQEGQVLLQEIIGAAGAGRMNLSGVYKLDARKSGAAIQMDLQQARTVVLDDVPVELTGTLSLTGENPPYVLAGRLRVANAVYSKEFKVDSVSPATPLKAKSLISFDIDLNIEASSRIVNSLISSSVVGDLRLTGSELEPIVLGEIDLKDGSIYANQNEFRISHGRVYIPADPNARISLNLRAQTELKNSSQVYRIEMNARGSVDNLELDLTSDPPLGQADIVSLLAFGVIRDDDSTSLTSDQQLFSAAQAEAFQSVFGKALGSSINKSTGFQVRLKPGLAQQAGNETLPNVSVVRKLSEKVTARFGRSLNLRNPEKDLQVDYELMNNVNVTGVWENLEENKNSLGVDLRFRIDIK